MAVQVARIPVVIVPCDLGSMVIRSRNGKMICRLGCVL